MRILGLDLSLTSPGTAIVENGHLVDASTIKVPAKLRDAARLVHIEDAVSLALFEPYKADLVAIEGYSFGAKNAREALGELGGVVRRLLYLSEVPYIVIPPTTWRKTLTGKGNLKKDMVGAALTKKYRDLIGDYDFPTLDALEAWAVAYAAWLNHTPQDELARQQRIAGG